MDALRSRGCGRAVLQLVAIFRMAGRSDPAARGRRRGSARLAAGAGCTRGEGAARGESGGMGRRRAMAPHATRRTRRVSASRRSHRYAWPMAAAGLDRRCEGGAPSLAAAQPALCINKCSRGPSGGLPGTHWALVLVGRAGFPGRRGACRPGGPLTTDRLVTTFHASKAQSDPRKVSPMNFSRGSRSIQRLLAARPLLTCWSRGRA